VRISTFYITRLYVVGEDTNHGGGKLLKAIRQQGRISTFYITRRYVVGEDTNHGGLFYILTFDF